jgi:cold shock CspA family protein
MSLVRDLNLARRAKKHGANYSLRIVKEARRAGIPISLGFALIDQESNFKNVFGHDSTIFRGAGNVTKGKYTAYKQQRGPHGKGGMQGVGPAQLTWYEFQDQADKRGGAWVPKHNISVAFDHLASLIRHKGMREGIAAYNGSGDDAAMYATSVLSKQRKWHNWLS